MQTKEVKIQSIKRIKIYRLTKNKTQQLNK